METLRRVRFVLWLILFLNIGVALAKVIFGYLANSLSMTADGFHSLSDGTSNVIGLIGVWIASKPADKEHPYGHRKFETFATMGIAALLLFVAYEVASGVLGRIRNPVVPSINTISFAVMIVTLVINIFVYLYEVKQGRKLNSDFLVSDAYHTRSDILVSLSVIGGLAGVKFGWLWLDWALGLVISVLIMLSAWEIVRNGAEVLCDAAVLDPKVIDPLVTGVPGVETCHQIRSRGRSDSVYVDLHVEVDPELTVQEAHDLAHAIEAKVKSELDVVEEVLVHVEPRGDGGGTAIEA